MNKVFEKIIEKLEELKKSETEREDLCDEEGHGDGEEIYEDGKSQGRFEQVVRIIEIVKQEAEQYKLYDTISIHTNGLEEGIRCAVCTNRIKSDTGCDGGCRVDENLVKRICDVIHNFECKPY